MKTTLLLLFVFLANVLQAQTQPPLQIENALRVYPLDGHTSIFTDTTGALTFEEISRESFEESFPLLDATYKQGPKHHAYWLKTRVVAKDSFTDWLLLLKNPNYEELPNRSVYTAGNEYVDAWYRLQNGQITHYRDGFLVPKNKRTIYRAPLANALPFSLTAGDTATLFVRVFNPSDGNSACSLELRPQALGIPMEKTGFMNLMGISMGVTGILALLCIFFFFAERDPANLFFSLLCMCLMLHYSLLHNELLFVSWFIPERPWLAEYAWLLLINGSFIWFILFGRSFVNLRQHSLLLDRLMLGMAGAAILSTLFSLLNYGLDWGLDLNLSVLIVVVVLMLAIRIGFFKNALAKIFAAGAIWLLFFSVLGLLYNAEIFTWFIPWPVGQMGLMVIYTYGLAYKLQLNEQAKAEARRILELDAVKSRFFANISHEFRTPLTLILGPLKKAQEQLPSSEQDQLQADIQLPYRHVTMMRRNTERLTQLIDQLLDLSKLENGSMKLRVTEGDIGRFLRTIVFSFESLAERKHIHFQTSFPENDRKAWYDQDKMEKIIVNLLSNAFKYTPKKGSVAIKTALDNGRLKISVEDNGPGISEEDLDKIFDRFYRIEGAADKGTGIGLALVKELVELHRGQITVESVPGKGTAFKVSLSVQKDAFDIHEQDASLPVSEALPMQYIDDSDGQPRVLDETLNENTERPLLLIAEDNPDLRRFIAESMQDNFRIISAENGAAGLTLAIDQIPDLVISDVMMPEMDGFELCRRLKMDEHTSHIPVILLTAKAGQQHKLEGLETGADAYLTKPFDEQELHIRARNLVEQRRILRERYARPGQVVRLQPESVAVTSADERFLQKVSAAIEANMDNEFFSVEDLASAVAFSRSQLHRKVKALTGESPSDLIRSFRLTRAKELLEKGAGNVSEVAMEVGYSSLSYFTRSFKQAFGVLPSEV